VHLVLVDEVAGTEDEHFAHHVGVLLVAAYEADNRSASREDRLELFG
jgi:hypothetical protein